MTLGFTTKQSCVFFFSYGWRHCNLWTQPAIICSTLCMQVPFHWLLFTSTSQIIFDSFYFIFVRNKAIFTKNKLLSDSKGIHHFLKPLLAPCKVWEERKVAIVFTRIICARVQNIIIVNNGHTVHTKGNSWIVIAWMYASFLETVSHFYYNQHTMCYCAIFLKSTKVWRFGSLESSSVVFCLS